MYRGRCVAFLVLVFEASKLWRADLFKTQRDLTIYFRPKILVFPAGDK